ncbi:MAG TPA: pre-pilin like leader sequence [Stenotrophomonas sp.]|uniref:GspH/FimT family pseudopilin n=1 Tax=unclassified Stenotrophomonas TaxID=196198 RepID=UPI000DE69A9A|nr:MULTISPECIES: Tfp pilus assembly protein FimT/FimU [unclassified Stenotrophomonas]PWB26902.1 pre-pilin like leader sequence [Stenotrophomonas sp. SPM]HCR34574.1 pre-pilin like leader sequence [Stenotrophomonas sp.]
MSLRRSTGFTLVELMVTVAVLAMLSTIAYPSFRSTIRSNRMATTSNELMGALALARSEAIRGTRGGGVCASKAGTACDGSSWADGWMVWNDTNGNGSFDNGEAVLRFAEARSQMQGASGEALSIAFDPRGRSRAAAVQNITLRPTDCSDTPLQRRMTISLTGQVRLQKEACK